jgi:hypothetical protein
MKRIMIGVLPFAFVALAACTDNEGPASNEPSSTQAATPAATDEVDKAALAEEAKGAIKALAGPLQAELKQALQNEGADGAVKVCSQIAPQLAQDVSAERGLSISRVSLKNRNPVMGEPSAWQAEVLRDFDARRQAGEDPATIAYSAVVGDEFRFMKAVPTAPVCLTCHGTDLSPKVAAALEAVYPNDEATGYREGDIRGAFVVVKSLP